MTYDEKIKCLEYLKNVSEKEYTESEKQKIKDFYQRLFAKISKDLDFQREQHTSIHESIGIRDCEEEDIFKKDLDEIQESLLKLYFDKQITYQDIGGTKKMIYSKPKDKSDEYLHKN